jgi:hypothetical protein
LRARDNTNPRSPPAAAAGFGAGAADAAGGSIVRGGGSIPLAVGPGVSAVAQAMKPAAPPINAAVTI